MNIIYMFINVLNLFILVPGIATHSDGTRQKPQNDSKTSKN